MTPEQRERARRLLEDEVDEWELSADGFASFDRRHESRCRENATALRAVLEMLVEPVGYVHVHRMPHPDESGSRVWVPDQYAEDSAETAGARCKGHFPVVALLPVRKGGES